MTQADKHKRGLALTPACLFCGSHDDLIHQRARESRCAGLLLIVRPRHRGNHKADQKAKEALCGWLTTGVLSSYVSLVVRRGNFVTARRSLRSYGSAGALLTPLARMHAGKRSYLLEIIGATRCSHLSTASSERREDTRTTASGTWACTADTQE
eukprot:1591890-Amphidinium_carterae.1